MQERWPALASRVLAGARYLRALNSKQLDGNCQRPQSGHTDLTCPLSFSPLQATMSTIFPNWLNTLFFHVS